MRKYSNLKKQIVTLVMALAMLITTLAAMIPEPVEAATVKRKMSESSITIDKGTSYTLKILTKDKFQDAWTGEWIPCWNEKKVSAKWTSSNKKVATVSSKGKVTAKKTGTATITAKVGSKSYKCKVTVLRPVSKSLIKITSIPTVKSYFCGASYKVTNKNDYTVDFTLRVKYYDETGDLKNYCDLSVLVGPGETIYTTANGPYDGSYDIAKAVIKDLKKSEHKSAVKDLEVTLNEAGDCVTVKNNSDFTVTYLNIDCWRYNENKEINMVIGLYLDNFSETGLKPGKTYTCEVNKPNTNWLTYFGEWVKPNSSNNYQGYYKPGKPDRIVINEASDYVVNSIKYN